MHFDLTDLRLFLNVHLAGTITDGARLTNMTLASASERIRSMESELGLPLLTRERRGVRATPAGHALAHHARTVLQQMERMRGDLGEYSAGLKGYIRLLCNTSALSEHIPQVLAGFMAKHPQMSVDLEEKSSHEIAEAVRNSLCDIGVASDAVSLAGMETRVFRPDPLVLVMERAHVFATRRSLRLAEVLDREFVGLTEGGALQALVTQQAWMLGKRLGYRVRLRNFETICRMAGLGVGLAIVPKASACRHARTAKIRLIPLSDAWATRDLVICTRNLSELPIHAQRLVEEMLASAAA